MTTSDVFAAIAVVISLGGAWETWKIAENSERTSKQMYDLQVKTAENSERISEQMYHLQVSATISQVIVSMTNIYTVPANGTITRLCKHKEEDVLREIADRVSIAISGNPCP